ncbi:MAG: hypothetical protein KDE27_22340 [Planctomycetes bacterium]|nr:hypothetical protein [Planctomycetota bacterium]
MLATLSLALDCQSPYAGCEAPEQALRCYLHGMLTDTATSPAGAIVPGNRVLIALHSAAVADLAATQLNRWWPNRYPFDPATTRSTRRLQIEALRAGRPSTLRRPNPDAATRSPRIATVSFAASAKALGPAQRQRIELLCGHEADTFALFAALVGPADECSPRTLEFDLERMGGQVGFRLVCGLGLDPNDWQGARLSVVATAAGKRIARSELHCARIPLQDLRDSLEEYRASVDEALARPISEGVEVTLGLGQR